MVQRVSKSIIACTIDYKESALVRLKTSGSVGYTLCDCKILSHGLKSLALGNDKRILSKLTGYCSAWKEEKLALSVGAESLLTLPVCFPVDARPEESREYCRIEAEYFLNNPEKYGCDIASYANHLTRDNNRLLLFYPAEPCRRVTQLFSDNHPILFASTTQLPLVHLSKFTEGAQVILEVENSSVLLTISRNGVIEKLSFHHVKTREEAEYFAMRELMENPSCRTTALQVTGTRADKAMMLLIAGETSLPLQPLNIPTSLSISNPHRFSTSSPSVVKAISTALMALAEQE